MVFRLSKSSERTTWCARLSIPSKLAEWTGLEPATPGVTGRYSNQLNYHSDGLRWWVLRGSNPRPSPCKGDALPAELSTRMRALGSALVYGILKGFARFETWDFRRFDLYSRTGLGISPSACGTTTHDESTKANQAHLFFLFKCRANIVENRIYGSSCRSFCNVCSKRDGVDQFCLVHGDFPLVPAR